MPRAPVPCPVCRKTRRVSGQSPKERVCWDCHLKGLGSPSNPKKPGRHQQVQMSRVSDRQRTMPSSSWWATAPRDQWFKVYDHERVERFQAAGIGRERPALGMPAGGYANGYLG